MDTNIFSGKPTEPANVEAPTESDQSNVDGGKADQDQERTYTSVELETIVKDRLRREQKKFTKQFEAKVAELDGKRTPEKSSNVEEDLRSKLSKYEVELKAREAKLDKYKSNNLRSAIEKSLTSAGCIDPELVTNDFLARNLVRLDDEDDEVIVENASGNLDDLSREYLEKKPHLRRGTSQGGAGSKGPGRSDTSAPLNPANAKNWTADDLKAFKESQNIKTSGGTTRLFF